jgi:hypothetical protein
MRRLDVRLATLPLLTSRYSMNTRRDTGFLPSPPSSPSSSSSSSSPSPSSPSPPSSPFAVVAAAAVGSGGGAVATLCAQESVKKEKVFFPP